MSRRMKDGQRLPKLRRQSPVVISLSTTFRLDVFHSCIVVACFRTEEPCGQLSQQVPLHCHIQTTIYKALCADGRPKLENNSQIRRFKDILQVRKD